MDADSPDKKRTPERGDGPARGNRPNGDAGHDEARDPAPDASGGPADHDPRATMRATDDERRIVADELAAALGRGQLTLAEFEQRTASAWEGRTRADVCETLRDLVPDPLDFLRGATGEPGPSQALSPSPGRSPAPARRPGDLPATGHPGHAGRDLAAVARAHVTGETGGSAFSGALMFGNEQKGDWLCAARHTAVAIMGGIDIDLRNARLESNDTTITVVAIMGGIDVIVPEDLRVTVQGTGIMGGFGSRNAAEVTISGNDLPPDAPTVRIVGVALMGGIDVIRKPRYRRLPGGDYPRELE